MKVSLSLRVCVGLIGTWVIVSVLLIAWSLTEFVKDGARLELQDPGGLSERGNAGGAYGTTNNGKKIILLWGEPFEKAMKLANLKNGDFLEHFKCKSSFCEFTTDRSALVNANAVIFDGNNLIETPPPKGKHHIWIFYANEQPKKSARDRLKNWKNLFNLTMTYKKDSDIRFRFGNFTRRSQSTNRKFNSRGSKKKLVAWINNDCNTQSKREEYVKQLQKHITVDIFGKCGNSVNCSIPYGGSKRSAKHEDSSLNEEERTHHCMQYIEKNYKFYLSLEDQLCSDYISTDFFETLNLDIIPVIRSGANLNELGAPFSFINTRDFKTPARVAKYLHFLDKNTLKYDQYFEWKNRYIATVHRAMLSGPHWCELCAKLNQNRGRRTFHSTLEDWWDNSKNCKEPEDLYVLI